ncbi:MAG: ornithine carbamoyltransferase [Clostridium sp.]|jgi:ornithine carbamoyltransferase|uniref:ornithine carbamoyltransferase n=1 Tax=Clostridium sp. TaxID=1506 RepID=UPI002673D372|nr:ornithine carbamoyltransferase [Clostridium sp.]MCI7029970.1 ornithine carbamoyltransferase [Clostridium sp.]MDD7683521.1 ornithine carbamoyltransferase [Clostridium sp.]MDY2580854.1 ornithine carbamoyltransferase [Clostridium sp.]
MKKDLLRMDNLSKEEILDILNLADQLKYENKHGIEHHLLKGKSLGMIFEKASTRTRVSFEVGMYELGGHPLFLSSKDLQIGRGEPIQDTARVLSRYLDGIMIRTFSQKGVETLAEVSSIPIINGLTDDEHPCQVLADLMTIREKKLILEGLKVAYIGDGNNMCNSLLVGCLTLGMHISIANPEGYKPPAYYVNKGNELAIKNGVSFFMTESPEEAVKDADVVITDVWASMGQEKEAAERMKAFKGYQVNKQLMSLAKNDAIVLHCLPAHREEEITEEILEAHADTIFEEAENRLHAQKAILVKLLS